MAKLREITNVCRAEHCPRLDVHEAHYLPAPRPERKRTTVRPPWQIEDPSGLAGAVARATSRSYPVVFSDIAREVRDDYGHCTDRTVYRALRKLVLRGHLLKIDVGLDRAAYVRPKTRLTPDAVREYLLSTCDINAKPSFKRLRPL